MYDAECCGGEVSDEVAPPSKKLGADLLALCSDKPKVVDPALGDKVFLSGAPEKVIIFEEPFVEP